MFLTKSFSLEVGPSFNFLVNEKVDGVETDFARKFEFGAALGASYKFGRSFFGSARYIYGLTNAFDEEYYTNKANNNAFQIGVGFIF